VTRVTPRGLPSLPEVRGAAGGRPLTDIPEVYRSRLDPNRSALAQRAGASPASEQAVERALDWLSRHQDADGRWDAGTAKYSDGTVVPGDDNFTAHCPPARSARANASTGRPTRPSPGWRCWPTWGPATRTPTANMPRRWAGGSTSCWLTQKPDGDLRGTSKAVGMYCHAMAALSLCEAYALTGDARLRGPVERAVAFWPGPGRATAWAGATSRGRSPATPASWAGWSWC
jgi:hypothetical protein